MKWSKDTHSIIWLNFENIDKDSSKIEQSLKKNGNSQYLRGIKICPMNYSQPIKYKKKKHVERLIKWLVNSIK